MLPALAILAGAVALAQETGDEAPLRPEDAFRYAVTDTGDAFEVDWAIEDGYYLYRDKLAFDSPTPGIVLGKPRLPAGLPYEDEWFGKQQIYRENFYVRIPYRIEGEAPATAELVITSQGCADVGLCYPPQTWTEEVPLRKVAAVGLTPAGNSAAEPGLGAATGDFPPPDEVFFPDVFAVDGNTVEVGFRIIPGYYLYKDKLSVRALGEKALAGRLELPAGKVKFDEFFGESEVYYDEVLGRLSIARATPEAMDLDLEIGYQGCADGGLCYLPQTKVLTVSLPAATTVTDLSTLATAGAPLSEQGRIGQIIAASPLWTVVTAMFGFGLLLAFTPCVLPMVPILTAIIAGEGDEVTPGRGFGLALSYVLGMAIVYTAAGVVAVAAGAQVQAAFNQPWVLTLFAALFVVLAAAMFGAFDLQMPSALQSRLAALSADQKRGTVVGAFVMGALSSLIVTACVAPALVAALAVMAQSGDYFRGGLALFAMSLGMGAPLLLVGAAQGKFLPKAGPWMVAVKGAFGFVMLGLAIWMLSRFLPGTVILALWAVLIFMLGVFMGGLTTLGTDSSVPQKLGKGFGSLAILYGVLLVIGAAAGGSNPLRPLAALNLGGAGGTLSAAHEELPFRRIKTVADLDRELEAAAAAGRSTMLDFYADWCVSCKEMEAWTFTDPTVQAALANTVWLQADVTANDAEDKALLDRFGVFGPPTIIFFGSDGEQRHGYEVVGYMKAENFAAHVRQAIAGPGATLSAQAE
ncbi:MAG: protein-disulfide reductase DsbD [Woeseiaceae bacterium]|nr:protein-disulfide reductase DsbD [Woeseiaceae bacterium]